MEKNNEKCRLQEAVEYLTDYSGVIGAVVADHEGLVVACSPPSVLNGELYAALGPDLFDMIDKRVEKLFEPGCRYFAMKTGDRWFTVAATLNLYLIVLADKKADDLLNVRIQRALEMITTHMKEKYPAEVFSSGPKSIQRENTMEATHV